MRVAVEEPKSAVPRTAAVTRRGFLRAVPVAGALAVAARPGALAKSPHPSTELEEISLAELQRDFASGHFTARSLTEKYLERIRAIDRNGPRVNSVIELNPDALAIASALDRERKAKGPRGPLHGIPVLIKDNIATHDRMQTTAGSLALVSSVPPRDSFVAQRLRAAGALILGKTNLSEWANFRSSHSTSGWSGRGGLTRNPYALDRNPCGSSSGSGAAASANLCAVAIGTETDGSVVCPSSANGLVGIKPTVGLVSRSGIVPISHSQDTAGPMARTVADAAALLGVMAGSDPADPATADADRKRARDYTSFLEPHGLKGARLGIMRSFFGFNEHVDKLMDEAIANLKREGAEVIDPVEFLTKEKVDESELTALLYEFKSDLNAYLAALGPTAPVHSLKEAIAFNERHRMQEMPYFGQEIFIKAEEKGPLTDKAYRDALEKDHRLTREEGIDGTMQKHKLDALVAPTAGPPWTTDLVNGDHDSGGCSTPPAVAGYPHITVPGGFVFGLPVGISFFGRAWSEPVLIRLAFAFEQATRFRHPPRFLSTADLKD
jgi:amidase